MESGRGPRNEERRPAPPAARRESPSPANITLRHEVGGISIEASKIAGHASLSMTGDYTVVQLKRQDELTRAIQDRIEEARKKQKEKAATERVAQEQASAEAAA
jgi:hypothetical protein